MCHVAGQSADGGRAPGDLWQFDTLMITWIKLDPAAGVQGQGPSQRLGHAMTSFGDTMLLFGGYRGTGGKTPATPVLGAREKV